MFAIPRFRSAGEDEAAATPAGPLVEELELVPLALATDAAANDDGPFGLLLEGRFLGDASFSSSSTNPATGW